MNRDEFLDLYRAALEGKVSDQIINDNISYYRSYINGEIRKGRSEQEVIKSLGDPRLLARTTQECTKFASQGSSSDYEYDSDNARFGDTQRQDGIHIKQINIPSWLFGIIIAIVVIAVLIIVFKVAFFLAPYIIALLIVGFIAKEIRNWINRY
jgi:uncharacterized membrane protein